MPKAQTAWDRIDDGQIAAPDLRNDPEVRKQKSRPALRAFFNIATQWNASGEDSRALLGWPAKSTFHKWKGGNPGTLSYDTLIRISLILGIYKALHILYPEASFADGWVKMPNSNPLFGGRTPLAFMTEGDVDCLYAVRRLLDGRRGTWN